MQPCKFKRLEMRVGGLGLFNVSSELPTSITLLWKPSLGRKVSGLLLWKITSSSKDGFTGFGNEGLDSGGNSASELGSEGFWSSDPLSAMCLAARISPAAAHGNTKQVQGTSFSSPRRCASCRACRFRVLGSCVADLVDIDREGFAEIYVLLAQPKAISSTSDL